MGPTVVSVSETLAAGQALAADEELRRLRAENARLLRLLKLTQREAAPPGPAQSGLFETPPGLVHAGSPPEAKVALFVARADVYAVRWENARSERLAGFRQSEEGGAREFCTPTGRISVDSGGPGLAPVQ